MTDESHLVPHTKEWVLYWTEQLGKYMSGEIETMNPLMPLDAWDAVQNACAAGRIDSPYAEDVLFRENSEEAARKADVWW